jgi:hypothetical protein
MQRNTMLILDTSTGIIVQNVHSVHIHIPAYYT